MVLSHCKPYGNSLQHWAYSGETTPEEGLSVTHHKIQLSPHQSANSAVAVILYNDHFIMPYYHDNRPSKVQYPVLQSQPEPQVRVEMVSFLVGHIFLQTDRSAVKTMEFN